MTAPARAARLNFAQRAETFGLDTTEPWALPALRLLFHAPRVFEPLLDAWDTHYPGTQRAMDRLTAIGFVAHQGPVRVDVRSGARVESSGKALDRYRITAAGRRLLTEAREDVRVLEDTFSRLTPANATGLLDLLDAFDLSSDQARHGISSPHAAQHSQLAPRTARWWVKRLVDNGLIRKLETRTPDARVVIPAHWRVTRPLCRQLSEVIGAFPDPWAALRGEFRLRRDRFLDDIDPARVTLDGGTDFDHDVVAQHILARLISSPRARVTGVFELEPRIVLSADDQTRPWTFLSGGDAAVFYQPDGVFIEHAGGTSRRCVVEYERRQSRRDAWGHIERFCGHLALQTLPFEPAVLRFVLDSPGRERSYVELIEAFADYVLDHPERVPANPVTLAVSSWPRLDKAADPLDDTHWFRVQLQRPNVSDAPPVSCRLHAPDSSPYDDYFCGTAP
jgi:hypothetical protein